MHNHKENPNNLNKIWTDDELEVSVEQILKDVDLDGDG